jgi:hypothetical protein
MLEEVCLPDGQGAEGAAPISMEKISSNCNLTELCMGLQQRKLKSQQAWL